MLNPQPIIDVFTRNFDPEVAEQYIDEIVMHYTLVSLEAEKPIKSDLFEFLWLLRDAVKESQKPEQKE
ncbi:hypothetical protein SAMN05421780_101560 [Flexibacter flexilis DSM 6793]|uniref:Uncharacterized protein n=1 Tax=Flexibacter flexilis DSM 6793 TaxID=927664 RepID=A0A1I1E5S7_9BACT|nr:hypothetical protein [Flexibacter flexilis]SFB80598.1 hypothetical protein SAMN05421780_101560 [Flexibacter flexilis DSM 6793]